MVPPELLTPGLLFAVAIAAAGGVLRGFTGTGNSMLMTPLYALLFGPVPTVALIVLFDVAVAIPLMRRAFRLTRWRIVLPLVVASWVTMPAGAWLLLHLDPDIMKKVMAATVLVFSLVLLTGWRYRGNVGAPTTLAVGARHRGVRRRHRAGRADLQPLHPQFPPATAMPTGPPSTASSR